MEIEQTLLGGQKLQGLCSCDEAIACLHAAVGTRVIETKFPLFLRIHAIARQGASPKTLFDFAQHL